MATSNYPTSLDDYSTLPSSGSPITVSSHYFGPAITNIEAELGTDPAGYATDVKTRLDDINPSEGNLNLDAGYGSKAPIYGVRAWVNFDGTTNVAGNCTIRASGNVSSVADNGTGVYTINFTSAMPDANYAVSGLSHYPGTNNTIISAPYGVYTGSLQIGNLSFSNVLIDASNISIIIHR